MKFAYLAMLVGLTGCTRPNPAYVCTPGEVQQCLCSSGKIGVQSCQQNTFSFGACGCDGDLGAATDANVTVDLARRDAAADMRRIDMSRVDLARPPCTCNKVCKEGPCVNTNCCFEDAKAAKCFASLLCTPSGGPDAGN